MEGSEMIKRLKIGLSPLSVKNGLFTLVVMMSLFSLMGCIGQSVKYSPPPAELVAKIKATNWLENINNGEPTCNTRRTIYDTILPDTILPASRFSPRLAKHHHKNKSEILFKLKGSVPFCPTILSIVNLQKLFPPLK